MLNFVFILLVVGLAANFSNNFMINNGYSLIYSYPYSYSTTQTDLLAYKDNYCNTNSILCFAGGPTGSDKMTIVACADCFSIIADTTLNQPVFHGAAYWYLTDYYSFGFSDVSAINQYTVDIVDWSDPYKLSWLLNGNPGYRVGTAISTGSDYTKYVFVKFG